MSERTHILLATLGGQPQVVTFTLDLLLKEYPISEVIVLHPKASTDRLRRSVACLQAEFVGDYYRVAERVIHFRSQVLQVDGQPMDDIATNLHADGTLDTIHQLIGDLKHQGHHIHLSVSGGRRLMSLLAISVATLNFDRYDHIWHIYTPQEIRDRAYQGAIMHVPPDAGVRLIQGPFIALGNYTYSHAPSFRTAQQEQLSQMEAQERTHCTQVVNEASPSQRRVLQAFGKGLRPQQVAIELGISLATVHSHKTVLLQLCRNTWNIQADEPLGYHFLQTKFAGYFDHTE